MSEHALERLDHGVIAVRARGIAHEQRVAQLVARAASEVGRAEARRAADLGQLEAPADPERTVAAAARVRERELGRGAARTRRHRDRDPQRGGTRRLGDDALRPGRLARLGHREPRPARREDHRDRHPHPARSVHPCASTAAARPLPTDLLASGVPRRARPRKAQGVSKSLRSGLTELAGVRRRSKPAAGSRSGTAREFSRGWPEPGQRSSQVGTSDVHRAGFLGMPVAKSAAQTNPARHGAGSAQLAIGSPARRALGALATKRRFS
jgi:hypothetical protein